MTSETLNDLKIGDHVKIIGLPKYIIEGPFAPIGTIGKVSKIKFNSSNKYYYLENYEDHLYERENLSCEIKIGDKMSVNDHSCYPQDIQPPLNSIGTVIQIRQRYKNTPNAYNQYKLSFPDIPDGDDLTNLYTSNNIIFV
jgi:hypothetical protein